jgi:hypothetical protein
VSFAPLQVSFDDFSKLNARIDAAVAGQQGGGVGAEGGAGARREVAELMRDASSLHETLLTHAQLHARHFLVAQAAYVRWEVHRGGGGGSEGHVTAALRSFLSVLRASLPPGQPSLSAAFKGMELAHVLVTASSSCLASAPRPSSASASASPFAGSGTHELSVAGRWDVEAKSPTLDAKETSKSPTLEAKETYYSEAHELLIAARRDLEPSFLKVFNMSL